MNRSLSIKEYMDNVIDICIDNKIGIYIYDTSTNNDTQEYINWLVRSKRCEDIIMYKRDNNYPDKTTDLKVLVGLEELKNFTDYVWLCGDGIVVDMMLCLRYIEEGINNKCKVIFFEYESDSDKNYVEKYDNCVSFFSEYGWSATSYGATIVSSKLIDTKLQSKLYERYRNTGFLYWSSLFTELSNNEENDIYVVHTKYFHKNKHKNSNASYGKGKFLKFWVENWSKAVYGLPAVYDGYKNKVAKDIGIKLHLYSVHNLIKLRGTHNLEKEQLDYYCAMLPLVTDVPYKQIRKYTYFPKWLAVSYMKIRMLVASVMRK